MHAIIDAAIAIFLGNGSILLNKIDTPAWISGGKFIMISSRDMAVAIYT
jgi:hypothetical protein